MNLAVDIGNTRIKVGLFDNLTLKEQRQLSHTDEVKSWVESSAVERLIVSSVATNESAMALGAAAPTVVLLDSTTPLPFVNTYQTPSTLGTDRIAAVAGAQHYFPQHDVLVIDAGTCITYDLLDQRGYYQGGLISPGLRMRLRAMHTFTARLPLVEPDEARLPELTARTTADGLFGGATAGTGAEIAQMIRMYADKYSDLHVIISGGDAAYALQLLPSRYLKSISSITHRPELVLVGLNSILQYYVNHPR